jgi:Ca-activated chloride channel family protein
MCATDISPTRLAAAQAAALSYVNSQSVGARIGLVAFAGAAVLIQPPTTNHASVQVAINSLVTSRGTAVGDGIHEAVEAIRLLNTPAQTAANQALPEGAYPPEIIVLLTDGVTTVGEAPLAAALAAVENRIRIYTIGYGTANGGENENCGGEQFGSGEEETPFGTVSERGIDEATLQQVAAMTGGAYYAASSAGELQTVFRNLPSAFETETRTAELTVALAAVGALLAALAMLASAHWQPLM